MLGVSDNNEELCSWHRVRMGETEGGEGEEVTDIHRRALWAAGRTWAFALGEGSEHSQIQAHR